MTALPPADLVAHAAFVRRLARGLTRDDAEADDAAQETLARAMERPPCAGPGLGGWLAAVLRNVVRRRRRTDGRRARREESSARREGVPAVDDAAARGEALRRVTDAVNGLDPAAREVVWLRHYEDLPPRAIAARLALPVATVKKRLQRAHAALRARLTDGDGTPRVLLVLAGLPPPRGAGPSAAGTAAAAVGGVAVGTASKVGVAAALAAVLGGVAWTLVPAPDGGGESTAHRAPELAAREPAGAALAVRPPPPVAQPPVAAARPATVPGAAGAEPEPSGLLVEEHSAHRSPPDVVEGVILGASSLDDVVVTLGPGPVTPGRIPGPDPFRRMPPAGDGSFRFEGVAPGFYALTVLGPGRARRTRTLPVPQLPEGTHRQVSVYGTAVLEGRCFDRDGVPLRGARVTLRPEDWHMTGTSHEDALALDTDDAGHYRFEALHSGSYSVHVAFGTSIAPDFRSDRADVSVGETRHVDLGDSRPEPTWRGATRTAAGAPLRPPTVISLQDLARGGMRIVPVDVDGRIEARMPRGTYSGTVWYRDHGGDMPGAPDAPFTLTLSDEDVVLDVVARGVRVSGRVRTAPARARDLGYASIRLLPPEGAPQPKSPWSAPVARDGSFALAGVPAGTWRVSLSLPSGEPPEAVPVEVPADRDVEGVTLDLPR